MGQGSSAAVCFSDIGRILAVESLFQGLGRPLPLAGSHGEFLEDLPFAGFLEAMGPMNDPVLAKRGTGSVGLAFRGVVFVFFFHYCQFIIARCPARFNDKIIDHGNLSDIAFRFCSPPESFAVSRLFLQGKPL
jgi:hypothetical protein